MKRYCAHQRLILVILMVLVLGVQFVNLLSSSHTSVVHRHADSKGDAGKAHADHGHEQLLVEQEAARTHAHAHQHDLGDHTHDLPLRQVLADVPFSFMPSWHAEVVIPLRAVVVHPPERPPKPTVIASSI